MRAWGKLSKLLRLTSVSSKSYLPPKSCIPSRAKMMMKRKSNSSREAMERMELSSDATRLLRDVQYLRKRMAREGQAESFDWGSQDQEGLRQCLKTEGPAGKGCRCWKWLGSLVHASCRTFILAPILYPSAGLKMNACSIINML